MARLPRQMSESGFYHVVARGVSQQIIFEDDEDFHRYLELLAKSKDELQITVLAWCLMDNHVHLLLRIEHGRLSTFIQKVHTSYANYFNMKYSRVGHLFQGRFASEPVETEEYLLAALRYIHQNPEKAGIGTCNNYPWSSYQEYAGSSSIADTQFLLDLFGSKDAFIRFHELEGTKSFLDIDEGIARWQDREIVNRIQMSYGHEWLNETSSLPRLDRDMRVIELRDKGLSVRQISRLTGVSTGAVGRIVKRG